MPLAKEDKPVGADDQKEPAVMFVPARGPGYTLTQTLPFLAKCQLVLSMFFLVYGLFTNPEHRATLPVAIRTSILSGGFGIVTSLVSLYFLQNPRTLPNRFHSTAMFQMMNIVAGCACLINLVALVGYALENPLLTNGGITTIDPPAPVQMGGVPPPQGGVPSPYIGGEFVPPSTTVGGVNGSPSVGRTLKMPNMRFVNRLPFEPFVLLMSITHGLTYVFSSVVYCKYWDRRIRRTRLDTLLQLINTLNQDGVTHQNLGPGLVAMLGEADGVFA